MSYDHRMKRIFSIALGLLWKNLEKLRNILKEVRMHAGTGSFKLFADSCSTPIYCDAGFKQLLSELRCVTTVINFLVVATANVAQTLHKMMWIS